MQLDDNIGNALKKILTQKMLEEEITHLSEKYDPPKTCDILTQVEGQSVNLHGTNWMHPLGLVICASRRSRVL